MTKEEFIKKWSNWWLSNPDVTEAFKRELDEVIQDTDGVKLLELAASLVGNPGTNISSSTDIACEQWQKNYKRWRNSQPETDVTNLPKRA
jgi:hypothetical protein